jgi:hypothetical protein|tara:strand:- start:53 stop:688 length:636 start_codon:yes stop_codon:yes gene_type:complete
MNNKIDLIIAFFMIFITGCDFSPTSSSEQISDYEVIEMIKNAEKIEISNDELPSQSQATIEQEYFEYEGLANWKASDLGYMVELSGRGQRYGMFREAYFNMDGRKLDPNDRDAEDREYGDDRLDEDYECFELVLPVTYTMPDGSTITVEDESGYGGLREWQGNNPDIEGEPTIQYPVDVTFRDENGEVTITINSDEEYRNAQIEYCSSDRD